MKKQTNEAHQEVTQRVEALLARTITSHPPPESLRRQVQKRVTAEWERRPLTLSQRLQGLLRMPVYRRAWVSVAALAVVAIVAALTLPSTGVSVVGTAVGKTETIAIALTAIAVVMTGVWFLHKRKH